MTKAIYAAIIAAVVLFGATAAPRQAEACIYRDGAIICGSGAKASEPGPRGGDVESAAPTPVSTQKSPQNFTKG